MAVKFTYGDLPVISISPLFVKGSKGDDNCEDKAIESKRKACVREISAACREWGAFLVVDHGVPRNTMDNFVFQTKTFFALPTEDKNVASRDEKNARGYFSAEFTKQKLDWKEGFDYGWDNDSVDGVNRWPKDLEDFKQAMVNYRDEMVRVSSSLLAALVEGLGWPSNSLAEYFREGEHTSFVRLNHYPKCPNPKDSLGVYPHKDAGVLTVLWHGGVPGLQVYVGAGDGMNHDPEAEDWLTIKPVENAFIINVGDMAQVWSNDVYRAPLHRVVAQPSQDRFSAPFFYNPSYGTDIVPMIDKLSSAYEQDENVDDKSLKLPHYRPVNWGEFRAKRYAGDYADVGEEVQISHYRVDY